MDKSLVKEKTAPEKEKSAMESSRMKMGVEPKTETVGQTARAGHYPPAHRRHAPRTRRGRVPEARAPAREDEVEDEDEDETQGPITVVCVDADGTSTECVTTDPFRLFRERYGRYGELVHPNPSASVPAGTVLVVSDDAVGLKRVGMAHFFPLRTAFGTVVPIGPFVVASLDPASECLFASAGESVKRMIKAW